MTIYLACGSKINERRFAARARVPLGPTKPLLTGGALVQLKLNRITWVRGIYVRLGQLVFWNERRFAARLFGRLSSDGRALDL